MLRRRLYIVIPLLLALVLAFSLPVAAQPTCTDKGACGQVKVAQVPLPWQFWAYEIDADGNVINIIDKIRISPTWLEPPDDLPEGEGSILVRRWAAVLSDPVDLEDLVWDFDENGQPSRIPPELVLGMNWEPIDEQRPVEVKAGEDLLYPFGAGMASGAALIAYEVFLEKEDGTAIGPIGHFLNELAVLPPPVGTPEADSSPIIEVRVNFDIQNDTDDNYTNFELDFDGLNFTCKDIIKAIGFIVGDGSWGADPLVVRPIPNGTEVKWVEPCRPIINGEWLHGGLSFILPEFIEGNGVTVQGYWTKLEPKVWCIEGVNPHGKNVPPAGWSTPPGSKGGRNDDGFYQLFYCIPDCWPTADDPIVPSDAKIWVGTKDLGPLFGGYDNEVVVKITEAPGAKPTEKKIGSQKGNAKAVSSHITLPADPMLFLCVVNADGTPGKQIAWCGKCLVPPPPK